MGIKRPCDSLPSVQGAWTRAFHCPPFPRQNRIAEPTVALMSGNAMGDLRCRPMKSAVPGSTNDVDFLDGMQWGLSFLINPEPRPCCTDRSFGGEGWRV